MGGSGTAIITKRELQARFNSGGYLERAAAGQLIVEVVHCNHPSAPLAGEPFCTESQLLEYRTPRGVVVAVVHQYLRSDGTIGLSGVPDPKMVRDRGIEYYPDED